VLGEANRETINVFQKAEAEYKRLVTDIAQRRTIDKTKVDAVVVFLMTASKEKRQEALQRLGGAAVSSEANVVNVIILSTVIGMTLKLSAERINQLATAALLHDIGMVKLPKEQSELLAKSKVTPEQRNAITTHTILGYRAIRRLGYPEEIALVALDHHERWDGSGYPRGLSGEKISDLARIVAVAEAYVSQPNALTKLFGKDRGQFDDRVLKALGNVLEVRPIGREKPPSAEKKGQGGTDMPSGGLSGARVPRPPSGAPQGTISASLESPTKEGEAN
jgi:putative nucleotidyltransferase with HDIG domain